MALELRNRAAALEASHKLIEMLSLPFRPELREHLRFQALLECLQEDQSPRARENAVRRLTLVVEELESVIALNGSERAQRHERVELYLSREYREFVKQISASLLNDSDWCVRSACLTAANIVLAGDHVTAKFSRAGLLQTLRHASECERQPAVRLEIERSLAFWARRQGKLS